ncbi:MAG: ORF6N domain-containing protein [Betaproteobacteria bacterium]|nr:ORF6N domain-containing protein [Betaproteobacteria bacterium]
MEPVERIASRILIVRAQKVMLDADLAGLYGVTTKALNQAVKRNAERFPKDFAFQLTPAEAGNLKSQFASSSLQVTDSKRDLSNRSQIVTGSQKHRDPRFLPWVFTEHGALMAANLLRSRRAVQASLHVVRAFVRLREMVAANKELSKKLDELERRVSHHDEAIASIVQAIRELATPPEPKPGRRIGFISGD